MTNFDNVLRSLSQGGPGAVRYDGDSLTNDEEHQYRIDLAAMLEQETELIKFPDNVGSGATIAAAEEAINELRGMLLRTADGLRTVGEAAKKAAPAIRAGTAADPEVQEALRQSSAAYASVPDIVPPADDDGDGLGHIGAYGGNKPGRIIPETEVSPATQVSSAAPDMPAGAPAGTAPASAMPAPAGMSPATAAPMAGGPITAGGAAAPMATPSGFSPSGGGGGGPQNKPSRHRSAEPEPGPVTYGSGSTGPEVGGVMPIVNPSVVGGRVDPAQISGRTASTSTSAAESPLKMGPSGSVGQMGGMGGAPLGGGIPGGGGSGGGRPNATQPRRDRESERILTGEEARDKALISHILRDDDPVAEGFDAAEVLGDMLPDARHPAPAPHSVEPPQAEDRSAGPAPGTPLREPIPETRLREPTPPKPPAARQYPGEPADDELW
ncbi:hypothetical protein PP594_25950 [Mycobacteroides abscessus]|nr:hypothetical protein [Mycobacteroides abscessus]